MKYIVLIVLIVLPLITIAQELKDVDGKAYIVIKADSDQILYSKNPDKKLPIASVTKIMTAIVFLENSDLSKKIVYTRKAQKTAFANLNYPVNTKLTSYDALKAMLLPSSNDMAMAIACSSNSRADFILKMNEKAEELGMKNTNFVNVHGLDNYNHYSTARDLSILGIYAMKKEVFRKLIANDKALITIYNNGKKIKKEVRSTYTDFYKDIKGADGIKTGTTKRAGSCFVGTAKQNNVRLISVVLGADDALIETEKLFDFCYKNWEIRKIIDKKDFLPLDIEKEVVLAYPKNDVTVFIPKNQDKNYYKIDLQATKSYPIIKGQQIGLVKVLVDGNTVNSVALLASKTVLASRLEMKFTLTIFVLIIGLFIHYGFYFKENK